MPFKNFDLPKLRLRPAQPQLLGMPALVTPSVPDGLQLNCTSRCGASQYVQDVANPNWTKIQARLAATPSQTTAEMHIYVDAVNGRDNKDGSSWAKAKKTVQAAFDLVPFRIRHNVAIHLRGSFALEADPAQAYEDLGYGASIVRVFDGPQFLLIEGGLDKTVIAGPFLANVSEPTGDKITRTGAGWTPHQWRGWMVEIMPGHPCAGQTRTIADNTATSLIPALGWTADTTGATFRIVRPTTEITSLDTSGYANLFVGSIGGGRIYVQNLHFSGGAAYIGGATQADGQCYNMLQQCTFANDGAFCSFYFLGCHGNDVGCDAGYVNPDTFAFIRDPSYPQAGVGDTTPQTWPPSRRSAVFDFSGGVAYTLFSALQWTAAGPYIGGLNFMSSYIGGLSLDSLRAPLRMSGAMCLGDAFGVPSYNTVIEAPFGDMFPAIMLFGSNFTISDGVTVQGGSYGVEAVHSTLFLGTVGGVNELFGVYAHDASRVFLKTGAAPTLHGTGEGNTDLTADGTNPIPQGEGSATWISIAAGTPAYDTNEAVGAKVWDPWMW